MNLDGIEARAAAATEGPWVAQDLETDHGHRGIFWVSNLTEGSKTIAEIDANDNGIEAIWSFKDAEFIAHARGDVPALVAEVRRLRAKLEAIERAVKEYRMDTQELDVYDIGTDGLLAVEMIERVLREDESDG